MILQISYKLFEYCIAIFHKLKIATAKTAIAILYAVFSFLSTTIFCICGGGISFDTFHYLTLPRSGSATDHSVLVEEVAAYFPVCPAAVVAYFPVCPAAVVACFPVCPAAVVVDCCLPRILLP